MPTKSILSLLFLVVSFAGSSEVLAQAGALDPDFGLGGIQLWSPDVGAANGFGVAVQTDGKILVGGRAMTEQGFRSMVVLRFDSSGQLDNSFGFRGVARTDFGIDMEGIDLVVDGDGSILVAGTAFYEDQTSDIAVVRLRRNGNVINQFGDRGLALADLGGGAEAASSLMLQDDGSIVVVGRAITTQAALVRFGGGGEVDPTFGEEGWVVLPGYSWASGEEMAVQSDGRIVVALRALYQDEDSFGYDFTLARLLPADGALDSSFGVSGFSRLSLPGFYNHPYAIATQVDDKIVIGGMTHTSDDVSTYEWAFTVARALADGSGFDPGFGDAGVTVTDFSLWNDTVWDVTVQSSGKILAVGRANGPGPDWDFTVMRYDTVGNLDSSFGDGGLVQTDNVTRWDDSWAVTTQADGKIVVAGSSYLVDPNSVPVEDLVELGASEIMVTRYLGLGPASQELRSLLTEVDNEVANGKIKVGVAENIFGPLESLLNQRAQVNNKHIRGALRLVNRRLDGGVAHGLVPEELGRRWSEWIKVIAHSL